MSFPIIFVFPMWFFSAFNSPGIIVRVIRDSIYLIFAVFYAGITIHTLPPLDSTSSLGELWMTIGGFIGAFCLLLSTRFINQVVEARTGVAQPPREKGQ
jgi:hypothetical protein